MELIEVEVASVTSSHAAVVKLKVPAGTTIGEAVALAKMEIPPDGAVGVFGKKKKASDGLASGDRVEIYRALTMDPKDRRRERVKRR